MITEDIEIYNDGSWVMIPLTSTQSILFNNNDGDLLIRFGALSTSAGFKLRSGDTIIVAESVYVKPTIKKIGNDATMYLTVTR